MWPLFEECKMALECNNMEFLTFRTSGSVHSIDRLILLTEFQKLFSIGAKIDWYGER